MEARYVVHFIADHYGDDASEIPDEQWIADGCARGWVLLTKDKRIRYRSHEIQALTTGHLFCVADGNITFDEMGRRLLAAVPAIRRAVRRSVRGFWHVHADGRIDKKWP